MCTRVLYAILNGSSQTFMVAFIQVRFIINITITLLSPIKLDLVFYMFALLFLVIFFVDEQITYYESLSMFIIYIIYAIIMKYSERIEMFIKIDLLKQSKVSDNAINSNGDNEKDNTNTKNDFNNEMNDEQKHHSQNVNDHNIADSNKLSSCACDTQSAVTRRLSTHSIHCPPTTTRHQMADNQRRKSVPLLHCGALFRSSIATLAREGTLDTANDTDANGTASDNQISWSSLMKIKIDYASSIISNNEKPVDISWPLTTYARFVYVLLAPIVLSLYFTLPDSKKQSSRRYYAITFTGSILWIALFSYMMVWFASTIGETLAIPTEIMGLTLLAAGTSIPDLITSVIVARKGLGDMAVSSSIGSNLFDICVGLIAGAVVDLLRDGTAYGK
ncbi:unnamed protein product [Anisakis simplex]|uniref:Na_Ca_ex domain-containing protein n=1 Tax=Anisakis simplex TaxID=6269 RepID=A0A0M3IZ73_ANISI|nr:unnamed protein product [Anisakis simplex]